MENEDLVKSAVVPNDQCPKDLRTTIQLWKNDKVSGEALSDAGFASALDLLGDYRAKALPTEPEGVRSYRALSVSEKKAWSDDEKRTHRTTYSAFYAQEAFLKAENVSNKLWLRKLLAWAQAKSLPGSVLASIRQVLSTHEDVGEPLEA